MVEQQQRVIIEQVDRIVELQRRLGQDSSTSSRPPSSDALQSAIIWTPYGLDTILAFPVLPPARACPHGRLEPRAHPRTARM
jgi:hypothetical protein